MGFARLLAGVQLLFAAIFMSSAHALEPPRGFAAVFDGQEIFSANLQLFPEWTGVLQRSRAEIGRTCSAGSSACPPQEWHDILRHVRGLSPRAKVEYVNAKINAHPYVPSVRNWGKTSYWETPFEFLRRNGQCQDYATTKFILLRAAGFPNDAMRLVVTHDFVSKQDHAILLVDVDGEAFMLDNLAKDIVPAAQVHRYRPYYSINEVGWWQHLPRTVPATVAGLHPARSNG